MSLGALPHALEQSARQKRIPDAKNVEKEETATELSPSNPLVI